MQSFRLRKTQPGFALLELAILIVVVGLIAGTGWWALKQKNTPKKTTNSTSGTSAAKDTIDTKEPLKVTGKTATTISKTTIDNVLSSADAESSLIEQEAEKEIEDANTSVKETTSIGDAINANF